MTSPWSVRGADGEMIVGDCHEPAGQPAGVVVLAHGFKGYKDYGPIPRLADALSSAGFIAHRFNFSHSGMTRQVESFERPDLFERCTWNRLVDDLSSIGAAVESGRLAGSGLPLILAGHSRGGTACLLAAGRGVVAPAGVAALAAPASCGGMSDEEASRLLREGSIESPSSRTGQLLRVGRAYLDEQLSDPEGHDVLELITHLVCPVLLIHGDRDPTVPLSDARLMVDRMGPNCRLQVIEGADHVFNTPNPMPADHPAGPELQQVVDGLVQFTRRACAA